MDFDVRSLAENLDFSTNSFVDVGVYTITATLTNENYITKIDTEDLEYTIVGSTEVDVVANKISNESPIAANFHSPACLYNLPIIRARLPAHSVFVATSYCAKTERTLEAVPSYILIEAYGISEKSPA